MAQWLITPKVPTIVLVHIPQKGSRGGVHSTPCQVCSIARESFNIHRKERAPHYVIPTAATLSPKTRILQIKGTAPLRNVSLRLPVSARPRVHVYDLDPFSRTICGRRTANSVLFKAVSNGSRRTYSGPRGLLNLLRRFRYAHSGLLRHTVTRYTEDFPPRRPQLTYTWYPSGIALWSNT